MKRNLRIILFFTILVFFAGLFKSLSAFDDGITGVTKKGGLTEGCSCHNLTPYPEVSVIIVAPSVIAPNDTADCQLRILGGPLIAGGCDIAVGVGKIITSPLDTILQRLETTPGVFELTHRDPKFPVSDTVIFYFRYIAPSTANVLDTIFANGNSVNHDTTPSGDKWNFATNKLIQVSNSIGIANNTGTVKEFKLYQNYPNPFNPETNIKFDIKKAGVVSIKIYDVAGKEVAVLLNERMQEGTYERRFTGNNFSSGIYFYTLYTDGNLISTRKMILIK